ncbi:hypothetical protein ACOCJ5_17605 [Knoellia sp. CPCC 206450]|uniref:hypothetical protein n=1 Tax=Knoellia tibetensis TaxID=3404798 RepID=UPI003B437581
MSQQHDDTTRIETLLDESGSREEPGTTEDPGTSETSSTTEAPRTAEASGATEAPRTTEASGATGATTSWSPYDAHRATPEFKSGPAPTTSVVGLLGLLTVIAVLVAQATDLDIPWGVVGPVAVVGAGVLLVVLGLAGLRGQRYRG